MPGVNWEHLCSQKLVRRVKEDKRATRTLTHLGKAVVHRLALLALLLLPQPHALKGGRGPDQLMRELGLVRRAVVDFVTGVLCFVWRRAVLVGPGKGQLWLVNDIPKPNIVMMVGWVWWGGKGVVCDFLSLAGGGFEIDGSEGGMNGKRRYIPLRLSERRHSPSPPRPQHTPTTNWPSL